ncbi:ABC transporter permease [Streptomyces sp. A1-5]|uniref:ABC transporter permease n=1 Tax=Streptomyces sp. A1-5 TaxID=2738410 RepID=UPI001F38C06A|nr:ABC transporter permease [Streptomyces sp. A1-5]
MNPAVPTWAGVAASASLVLLAAAVAWRQKLQLVRDIAVAAVRAGVQLIAVGAILLFVFRHAGLAGAVGSFSVRVQFAAAESGEARAVGVAARVADVALTGLTTPWRSRNGRGRRGSATGLAAVGRSATGCPTARWSSTPARASSPAVIG